MGVTFGTKNINVDMGYFNFKILRTDILRCFSEKAAATYEYHLDEAWRRNPSFTDEMANEAYREIGGSGCAS